jgi:hypothetical protein
VAPLGLNLFLFLKKILKENFQSRRGQSIAVYITRSATVPLELKCLEKNEFLKLKKNIKMEKKFKFFNTSEAATKLSVLTTWQRPQ